MKKRDGRRLILCLLVAREENWYSRESLIGIAREEKYDEHHIGARVEKYEHSNRKFFVHQWYNKLSLLADYFNPVS